eukprot:Skav231360  [mRNA]  locus=scaffold1586:344317:344610:- [translate_table: standard]
MALDVPFHGIPRLLSTSGVELERLLAADSGRRRATSEGRVGRGGAGASWVSGAAASSKQGGRKGLLDSVGGDGGRRWWEEMAREEMVGDGKVGGDGR